MFVMGLSNLGVEPGFATKVLNDKPSVTFFFQDSRWVEEKQLFMRRNQELLEKVGQLDLYI